MSKHHYIYLALVIVGIALALINETLGFIYAAIAVVILAAVQITLLPGSGNWALIGGKPNTIITGNRKIFSICAISVILSVLCGFLIKIVLNDNAL